MWSSNNCWHNNHTIIIWPSKMLLFMCQLLFYRIFCDSSQRCKGYIIMMFHNLMCLKFNFFLVQGETRDWAGKTKCHRYTKITATLVSKIHFQPRLESVHEIALRLVASALVVNGKQQNSYTTLWTLLVIWRSSQCISGVSADVVSHTDSGSQIT